LINNNIKSLKEFVEGNDRLLTVIGVFAALTAIFLSEPLYSKGPSLSLLTFIIFLVLCSELFYNLITTLYDDEKEPSTNLVIFAACFIMLLIGVLLQLTVLYKDILLTLFSPMFAIFYSLVSAISLHKYIIKKYKRPERSFYRYWLFALIFITTAALFLLLFSIK
jgi:hypothetical protein